MQDGVNSPEPMSSRRCSRARARAGRADRTVGARRPGRRRPSADGEQGEQVTSPTKLIRIASMVRTMLDEVRRAPLDDAGRRRLREIHEQSLARARRRALARAAAGAERGRAPVHRATTRASRSCGIAQAQLVGWLEGLFHGIQATLFTQQAMAQQQLEEMRRRRALEPGRRARRAPPGATSEHRATTQRRLTSEWPTGRPRPGATHPAAQQPDWPDDAALEAVARRAARGCRRSCSRARPAALTESLAARQPRARRSSSRPATAPSRSTRSRPTPSATSSRSSCRWRSCSPTAAACPTVKIGRIAGQFAKPRSSATETRDGVELPSFRGDMVNDFAFDADARPPDPAPAGARLPPVGVHAEPAARVHQGRVRRPRRACTRGTRSSSTRAPRAAATRRSRPRSTGRCGSWRPAASTSTPSSSSTRSTSTRRTRRCILGYEEALTRQDSLTGDWYDCSAHLLWIGERTRQLDGAHVEFLSGIENPIGVKLGPTATPDEVRRALRAAQPRAACPAA